MIKRWALWVIHPSKALIITDIRAPGVNMTPSRKTSAIFYTPAGLPPVIPVLWSETEFLGSPPTFALFSEIPFRQSSDRAKKPRSPYSRPAPRKVSP